MTGKEIIHVAGRFIQFGLLCLALFQAGSEMTRRRLESEAIHRGFAEYNPSTGAWQWKEALSSCH